MLYTSSRGGLKAPSDYEQGEQGEEGKSLMGWGKICSPFYTLSPIFSYFSVSYVPNGVWQYMAVKTISSAEADYFLTDFRGGKKKLSTWKSLDDRGGGGW